MRSRWYENKNDEWRQIKAIALLIWRQIDVIAMLLFDVKLMQNWIKNMVWDFRSKTIAYVIV